MALKRKLRDLTKEEYNLVNEQYCCDPAFACENCPLYQVRCKIFDDNCWINYKSLYSEEFLNQEIVIENEECQSKKPILNAREKAILTCVDNQWKYIARDEDGKLCLFEQKPEKDIGSWNTFTQEYSDFPFNNQFSFIDWPDSEPYSIDYLLRKKQSNE